MSGKRHPRITQVNKVPLAKEEQLKEDTFCSQEAADIVITPANTRRSKRLLIKKTAFAVGDRNSECEECNRIYKGDCPVHGPLCPIKDIPVPPDPEDTSRDVRTAPSIVSVRQSRVPGAGRGVYATCLIPRRVRFGPFQGERKPLRGRASHYRWEIMKNGKAFQEVDASKPGLSNWMRYVNCGPSKEAENLEAFQFNGDIYYRTIRPIMPGEELFVNYGESFSEHLGLRRSDEEGCE